MHTGKFWMGQPGRVGFTDDMGSTGRHGGKALSIGRKSMEPIYDFMDKAKQEQKPFFVWYALVTSIQPCSTSAVIPSSITANLTLA